MLTADLVNARRRAGELRLVALDARGRVRAGELAAHYLELAHAHLGRSREEFDAAVAAIEVEPHERRLADGIRKLVEDRCQFDAEPALDPAELRRELFLAASAARQQGRFDRDALIADRAAACGLDAAALEAGLYADLRGAHRLQTVEPIGAARLVDEYDRAQAQAVLLRAVRVVVEIECAAPGAYRALFHKLKFLRLLYAIRPCERGYRVEIDGPFSLFESVTKYGLQLALALPALESCDTWRLEAELRWGKERTPLRFRLDGSRGTDGDDAAPRLADEVQALADAIRAMTTPWRVAPATELLDLPGVGLCVPDLVFEHGETGECVYLEVLGFWSREAVWRRVELVERGLGGRILFAVSKHLRVSEAALGDELPGALYVYKRVLHAATVLKRVEALARRVTASLLAF